MALSVTEANTVSQMDFDKVIVDNPYDNCPFYVKLKQKNRIVPGGTKITWPIRYQQLGRANAVGANDRVVYEKKDTRTQAQLDWAYYIVDALITWEERVKNTGKNQIVDLIADKSAEIKEDMEDRFATDLFTSNPNGKGFSSLATIVDSSDSYAGISPTDAANWAAIEDSTTTQLVLYGGSTSLYGLISQATFGTKKPNFHLTNDLMRGKFESLLEPQKRYEDKEMAKAGFTSVMFHSAPVIGDPYCPDGAWYGLCMDVFWLVYHTKYNMKLTPWEEMPQAGFPHALARTLSWVGNIKCKERKVNFKCTALDETL